MNTIITIKDCCDRTFGLYLFDPQESFIVDPVIANNNYLPNYFETIPFVLSDFALPVDIMFTLLGYLEEVDIFVLSRVNYDFHCLFHIEQEDFKLGYLWKMADNTELLKWFMVGSEADVCEIAFDSEDLEVLKALKESQYRYDFISPNFLYRELVNVVDNDVEELLERGNPNKPISPQKFLCLKFIVEDLGYPLDFDLTNFSFCSTELFAEGMCDWIDTNGHFDLCKIDREESHGLTTRR